MTLAVGLTLAVAGSAVLRVQPMNYTHAKPVGLLLFLAGEVILFRERWWLALIGFFAWAVLMPLLGITTRQKGHSKP